MARAMWKGRIQLGDHEVPVKLYAAVESRRVSFRLLHEKDLAPVSQKIVRKSDGREVPREEQRKAYPMGAEGMVVLDPESLAELEPEASRDIELRRFVPQALLGDQWYDRPYFLGPDGDEEGYFALVSALEGKGVEGIARWVMRNKRYVGSLRAVGGYLMLITLRRADQVVAVHDVQVPEARQPDPKELKMAEQLVAMLEGDFEPERWPDEYRERVMGLIDAKRRGESFEVEVEEKKAPTASLADALEQSLAAGGRAERETKEKKVA